jgi:type III restriction enzyme
MPLVTIDNPILNSPYSEPARHFRFDANDQITDTIDAGRRESSYFLPIAAPKKRGAPGLFDDVTEKKAESSHVNQIRQLVRRWRQQGWPDITPVTRALLEHWNAEDRFVRLFFCQIEALETLIFIIEVAKQTKYGQDWIEKYLQEKSVEAGTNLLRVACKMATGSGKTVVMSMLIAWQVLNKRATRMTIGSQMPFWSSRRVSPFATGCACSCRPIPITTTSSSTSFRPNTAAK